MDSEGDSAKFEIFNPKTGDLRFKLIPRTLKIRSSNSNDNSYKVVIQASDGDKKTTKELYINVTDKNEAPTFKNKDDSTQSIPENTSLVTFLEFDDNEDSQLYTFSLEGADKSLFQLSTTQPLKSPNNYTLSFIDGFLPSFEENNDSNLDGIYEVLIRVQDGGLSSTREINATILNQDDPPSFIQFPSDIIELDEDSFPTAWVSPTLLASDLESDSVPGDPVTWSVSVPPLHGIAKFSEELNSSTLSYVPDPDYFGPDQFTIRIDDKNSTNMISERILFVNVRPQDDDPSFTFDKDNPFKVLEESTRDVIIIPDHVSDIDSNVTASLVIPKDSNQNHLFEIDPKTFELRFKSAPDFETTDYNNTYIAEFQLHSSHLVQLWVTVIDQNDAPVFTADTNSTFSLSENSTFIHEFQSRDAEGEQNLIYSVKGGRDSQYFEFDGGNLSFSAAPDFENPEDLGGDQIFDNVYEVEVQVSDTGMPPQAPQATSKVVTVIVLDVNDAPRFITSAELTVNENATLIETIKAFDPDTGDTLTYSIPNLTNTSPVLIDSLTGALTLKESLDYEVKGSHSFDVNVSATDDHNFTATQVFKVSLSNINDNLPLIDLNLTGQVFVHYEFSGPVLQVSGSDADKDAVQFLIGGGADQSFFSINPLSGKLSFKEPYSFDLNNSKNGDDLYEVGIKAYDGSRYSPLYLINVDLRPIDQTPPRIVDEDGIAKPNNITFTPSVLENETFVYQLNYNDTETANLIVSIEGQDKDLFIFDQNSSTLSFISPPDYESGKTIYQVDVVLSNLPGSGIISDGKHVSVASFYIIIQPVDEGTGSYKPHNSVYTGRR